MHALENMGDLPGLRASLIRAAMRGGASSHDAEDLVQEAICRALNRSDSENLEAWLRVVVRNLAVDAARARTRFDKAAPSLAETGRERDPLEEVEDVELARTLKSHLCTLPSLQRDAIGALAAGTSIGGFATGRGISQRAAEGHLRRARGCLRRSLAAC